MRGFQILLIAVVAAVGIGVAAEAGSDGHSATASRLTALADFADRYADTVTSPIFQANGRPTDILIEGSRPFATSRVDVLQYKNGNWSISSDIGPVGSLLAPLGTRHAKPGDHDASVWSTVMPLTQDEPAVAIVDEGASGWNGLVVGEIARRWEVVPFEGYGSGITPYPQFFQASRVVTSIDDCSPSCAEGRWTSRSFRFDPTTAVFEQVGPARQSHPGRNFAPVP